ncbi:MAG: SDR family oxidoreductase [Bacteroidota bacterium]
MEDSKNILITGASRGIGYDTAIALATKADCQVFALSRNEAKLEKLREAAPAENIHVLPFDLANFDSKKLATFLGEVEKIDVLINNAGLLLNRPFAELTLADWKQLFNTNLFSTVQLIQTLLPKLKKAQNAHIVNIGSMGGVQGSSKFPGLSAYSASKAALANLTECLAEELKDDNIRTNCLALGAIQTEMLANAFPGYEAPVTSESMADYLAWFALNGHHFHNGKIIPVAVSTP